MIMSIATRANRILSDAWKMASNDRESVRINALFQGDSVKVPTSGADAQEYKLLKFTLS